MSVEMQRMARVAIREARVQSVRVSWTDSKGSRRSRFEWKPPNPVIEGSRLRRIPTESGLLLLVMAESIDNGGDYWRGDGYIVDEVGYSEAWVRKWRQPLIAAGVLELKEPARRDGNFESGGRRAHWLLFPWLHPGRDGKPPWA